MIMFRRRPRDEDTSTTTSPTPQVSSDGFSPADMRAELFAVLAERIGAEYAALLRKDFEHHVESDPVNGVEQAYFCLTGKLIETIDILNTATNNPLSRLSEAQAATDAPTGFTIFRKDVK